jgi:hypothetical protein
MSNDDFEQLITIHFYGYKNNYNTHKMLSIKNVLYWISENVKLKSYIYIYMLPAIWIKWDTKMTRKITKL